MRQTLYRQIARGDLRWAFGEKKRSEVARQFEGDARLQDSP